MVAKLFLASQLLSVCLWGLLPVAQAKSLIDFSAARGDNPSTIGSTNLEAARGDKIKSNTPDLYIRLDKDPNGTPALHYHRKQGDIRAEYHALQHKTQADQTYYIGYSFSLAEIEKSLMIWQFKEYHANNDKDNGANIPLAFEIVNNQLQFQYQADGKSSRKSQWSTPIEANSVHHVGLVINTAQNGKGWVELYWDGKQQTFTSNKKNRLSANTFPGRAEPKFGAYRGEAVGIDTYVYAVQIGTELNDIKEAAGLK